MIGLAKKHKEISNTPIWTIKAIEGMQKVNVNLDDLIKKRVQLAIKDKTLSKKFSVHEIKKVASVYSKNTLLSALQSLVKDDILKTEQVQGKQLFYQK